MNDACPTYEPLITERLFGDLDAGERERLDAHLDACPACRAAVREMEATLQLTAARERPEPSPAFWDGYYDRLATRLAEEEERRRDPLARLSAWWQATVVPRLDAVVQAPGWAYQLAAAVLLVAAGVFIGWLAFGPSGVDAPEVVEAPKGVAPPVQRTALEARTDRYLTRSKVLLLGLVNAEPDSDATTLGLSRKREVARELVAESDTLKAALSQADERALRALIDDLEVILLQIANLEATHDLATVEMVQRGVDSRALLLKINMTEMRRTGAAPTSDSSTF